MKCKCAMGQKLLGETILASPPPAWPLSLIPYCAMSLDRVLAKEPALLCFYCYVSLYSIYANVSDFPSRAMFW
ncbi:hypothetical protein DUNSADRAFT_13195 [Dunaliella salina]|uniref:Uncharacterized protein n=1 Tax=Dunaliella salina TaxID=3046 RepID=A0ABQ7G9V8_DUNSA|nr:hypothetical protein DUNSADRAFT_13195 [Dunaliella salina]|eukprot:KAF5831379.1 hypothetical protein DUNSADRAFT_13195 [Dunaliella salina]